MGKYYVDTAIWLDLYDNRVGFHGEPLGDLAYAFFQKVISRKEDVVISDVVLSELSTFYSAGEINSMIKPFEQILSCISASDSDFREAKAIAKARKVPMGDCLHVLLARNHQLTLITRNNHFKDLVDIHPFLKPEQVI